MIVDEGGAGVETQFGKTFVMVRSYSSSQDTQRRQLIVFVYLSLLQERREASRLSFESIPTVATRERFSDTASCSVSADPWLCRSTPAPETSISLLSRIVVAVVSVGR